MPNMTKEMSERIAERFSFIVRYTILGFCVHWLLNEIRSNPYEYDDFSLIWLSFCVAVAVPIYIFSEKITWSLISRKKRF